MVEEAAITSSTPPSNHNKPFILSLKRKTYHSPLEAFWLQIHETPVKRPWLDFKKLSVNDSPSKVEELTPKKFFAQHVQLFLASKPPISADALDSKAKLEDQRRCKKTDSKQKQLLVKSKKTQELLSKSARFKQIWKSRKGKDSDTLHDMCHLYDKHVDVGEASEVHEQDIDEEDQKLMYSFLTLLQEFIPSEAEEFDSDIEDHMIKQGSKVDYVHDLYAIKDDNIA